MAANLSIEITALIRRDFRRLSDRVHATEAWTQEGKTARKRLRSFIAELRRLAAESGSNYLVAGVELFEAELKAKSPGLFAGGSIN
jgi:hypothetical protein